MSQLKSMRQNQRNQITPLSTNPKTAPKEKRTKTQTNFAADLANREEDQDWMMDLPSNEKEISHGNRCKIIRRECVSAKTQSH